ncbi:carboxypeptidase B-like [Schistocerca nitens]|uniref:carboxypeptidase B-like n=1 Tax=Schistocerca nitens TaxID=7011 RepID=UPI0021177BC1|nr:carboxypeptidase B-like [Schistocerca nitens]
MIMKTVKGVLATDQECFNLLSPFPMSNYLDLLAKKYPPLVHVQAFGTSFEKRRLNMVKISTEKNGAEKPIILIDAGIHAREWIAPAMALFIINQLAENETNRYLTEEIEWHICPLLNPDGYEYSRKTDMWWRKTRSHTRNKHCRGVDGNRNFDFHWNECGASSDPCSGCYAGEKPFSEVETQAFRAYVMSIRDRLKLYLTFHSYGPQAIAESANLAQMKAGGPRFVIGSSENTLYCAAGGSDDWVMGIANISFAYTVEMPPAGTTRFHPSPLDIRQYVTPFFEAVRTFAHHVAGYQCLIFSSYIVSSPHYSLEKSANLENNENSSQMEMSYHLDSE